MLVHITRQLLSSSLHLHTSISKKKSTYNYITIIKNFLLSQTFTNIVQTTRRSSQDPE